jgi:hypothetical protein
MKSIIYSCRSFSDLKKRREEDKLASLKLCLEETKVAQKLCDELSKGL